MEKKYTLWERFKSDKPSFFKRSQILGLGLVALSVSLDEIKGIPDILIIIMASTGATIAALSQFAVKQLDHN